MLFNINLKSPLLSAQVTRKVRLYRRLNEMTRKSILSNDTTNSIYRK